MNGQFADTLFTSAQAFTADPVKPEAEAVAVQREHIVFVGSNLDARNWVGPATRIIDAQGRTLMPGFIDAHYHMLLGALDLDGIQLNTAVSYEDLAGKLLAHAAQHPDEHWLNGVGLRYNLGPGRKELNRHHLDEIAPYHPIYLTAYDGHTAWVNTLALKLAGIFHGGECSPNGEIVLDKNGEATGELREPGASKQVGDLVPRPGDVRRRELLQQALQMTASFGVTSVHNMNGDAEEAAMYAALEGAGDLTCRIYLPYSITPETQFEALEREVLLFTRSYAGEMLRTGCVKFFMDGVIESYTGLLVEPYADNTSGTGAANYEVEHYNRMLVEADRLGLQVFTHAVGDLGVRRVLDACELARRLNGHRDTRHRVEHIELIHSDDLHRFQELNVLASMQPLHAPKRADDGDVWLDRVGARRWPMSFAWQYLRQSRARLVFGSDWPVMTQDPIQAVSHSLNRLPWADGMPHHRQSLEDVLTAYTRDAAYAEFQEHRKGQLKAGYLADIVLLSADLFSFPEVELSSVRPMLTMVGGKLVFEA